jgi:aminoglycoside phosphotransferase (APT) family kinase protein
VLIERVVAEATGAQVIAVRPILGRGTLNRVYIVDTPAARYVARLGTEHGLAQYRKEAWCSLRAAEQGVPCPVVLAVGELAGAAYMLLAYVPGVDGDAASSDEAHLWRTLGSYAKRIHSIPVAGFGDDLVDPACGAFGGSWDRYVACNIARLNARDPLLRLGVFSPAQSRQLRQRFETLAAAPLRMGLSHGDLAPRNSRIDAAGRIHLLDWGCAHAHVVPHHEIAQLRRDGVTFSSTAFGAFLTGYGLTPAAFEALQPEIDAVTLLQAVDLVRWALDRSPEAIPRCVAWARATVDAILPERP